MSDERALARGWQIGINDGNKTLLPVFHNNAQGCGTLGRFPIHCGEIKAQKRFTKSGFPLRQTVLLYVVDQ